MCYLEAIARLGDIGSYYVAWRVAFDADIYNKAELGST